MFKLSKWITLAVLVALVAGVVLLGGAGCGKKTPSDITAPTVSSTIPVNAATGVAVNSAITATFSEAMDSSTITTTTFTLKQGTTSVSGAVTYAGVTATFTPAVNLALSTVYTATITTGAKDLAGNALAVNKVWTFTTGSAGTAATVSSTIPVDAATGVAVNSTITATFSEAMDPLTITTTTFTLKQGTTSVSGAVTYAGVTATFTPAVNLALSTVYTATITTGAKDLAGNALAVDKVWAFTTAKAPASVTISPTEAYDPIRTQHTLVAQVKAGDGSPVSGTLVEWILNRAPGAVGDIVSLAGSEPQKVDNTYGIVKTDDNGEARLTITSLREGDTDITAYVPGISDPAAHKQFAVKHWLDLTALFPNDAVNAVGTTHVLTVQTVKVSDGTPVGNVTVRFTITGNDPEASFKEAGTLSTTYTINTDPYGFAAVTLQQVTPAEGTNTVRIDILAPSNPDIVMVTKDVTKQWQATKLGLTKVGPEQIALLGQATYNITVDNTGNLTATGVVLTDQIPAGMSYVSSDPAGTVSGSTVSWNVGSLNNTESRSFELVLQGTQAGLWTNTVVATSNEVGTATAQATTRVLPAPEVLITKTGPSGIFTGFTRSYTLAVTNTGAVALHDVVVTDYLPALLSYVSSIPAGTVTGNQIAWNLGTLNIGESKEIVAILGGVQSGTAVNTATVTTLEGATSTDSLTITVLGAPGAHMSLIDSEDPVAVGDQFTYTIEVLNQSESNSLHNMTIVGLIPGEMVFVSADGPTPFTVVGQEVRFGAVAELQPGATVVFHIQVRATAAGAAVFSSTMRWDEFGEPIVSQEGTTVFQPQT